MRSVQRSVRMVRPPTLAEFAGAGSTVTDAVATGVGRPVEGVRSAGAWILVLPDALAAVSAVGAADAEGAATPGSPSASSAWEEVGAGADAVVAASEPFGAAA